MATVIGRTAASIAALLADKLNLAGGTLTGDLLLPNNKLRAGTSSDVLGSALEVLRNGVQVGRIDNNSSGLRVQAQSGTLQLRGSGNTGISIDSAGVADFASSPLVAGASLSEIIDDRVAALLAQGSGITLTYNDAAGTLTIAATSTGGAMLSTTAPSGWWLTAANASSSADMTLSPTGTQWPSRYVIPTAGTFDYIGLKISGADAAVSGKILLYNSDTLGLPKDLVYTSDPISFAATGDFNYTLAPLSLPAGVYWGFFRVNSAGSGTARIKGVMQSFQQGDMHPETFHVAQATLLNTWIKADPGSYASPGATVTSLSADYNTGTAARPSFGLRRLT